MRFLIAHPGAAGPRFYAEAFRKKVVKLREAHPGLALGESAAAACVPRGTTSASATDAA